MDQVKNITKIIINVLCILLFIILAIVIYAKLAITLNDDVHANYFGYRIFEVASGSMEPTLHINDILVVKVNVDDLKANDIIAYKEKDKDTIITHRIISNINGVLMVKGDANNTTDPSITVDQVIGKVVKVYPKLGIWKKIIADPKNLILMFITLLLFDAALSYDGKTKKENEKEKVKETPKKEKITLKNKDIFIDEEQLIMELPKVKNKKEDNLQINKVTTKDNKEEKEMLKTARDIALSQDDEKIDDQDKQKENKDIDYTIRLDLNEIQKNIDKSVK